jgi:hypothetical protein
VKSDVNEIPMKMMMKPFLVMDVSILLKDNKELGWNPNKSVSFTMVSSLRSTMTKSPNKSETSSTTPIVSGGSEPTIFTEKVSGPG